MREGRKYRGDKKNSSFKYQQHQPDDSPDTLDTLMLQNHQFQFQANTEPITALVRQQLMEKRQAETQALVIRLRMLASSLFQVQDTRWITSHHSTQAWVKTVPITGNPFGRFPCLLLSASLPHLSGASNFCQPLLTQSANLLRQLRSRQISKAVSPKTTRCPFGASLHVRWFIVSNPMRGNLRSWPQLSCSIIWPQVVDQLLWPPHD